MFLIEKEVLFMFWFFLFFFCVESEHLIGLSSAYELIYVSRELVRDLNAKKNEERWKIYFWVGFLETSYGCDIYFLSFQPEFE